MKAIAERAATGTAFLNERMTLRALTKAAGALFAALAALVIFYPAVPVIVSAVVVAAAGLLTGTVVYFTDKDGEQGSLPTDVPGQDGPGVTPAAASGDQHHAITHAPVRGEPGHPAGGSKPGAAGLEPGPESEPPSVTAPVPVAPARRGRHAAPRRSVRDRLPRPVITRRLRPVPPVPAVTADTLPAVLRREEATS